MVKLSASELFVATASVVANSVIHFVLSGVMVFNAMAPSQPIGELSWSFLTWGW